MNFTVVISCFNASKTIAKTFESLVCQTYSNFEVILIDDASDDYVDILSIVQQFKEKLNITVLRNSNNRNAAYSRNRGIVQAKGEYIAFLDADDTWVPDRLESAKKLIDTISEKRFVLYGRFELIQNHSTGALLPLRGIKKNELVTEYVFSASQQMQTSTFIFPSYIAREIMFDENLTRHQDSDLMMRTQLNGIAIIYQNFKCASYFFSRTDIKSRVNTGRISKKFCEQWLKEKQEFFNQKSLAGYKLVVFSRILYFEGNVFDSFILALYSISKIGFNNFIDVLKTKFLIIYQSKYGM